MACARAYRKAENSLRSVAGVVDGSMDVKETPPQLEDVAESGSFDEMLIADSTFDHPRRDCPLPPSPAC